MPPSLVDPLRHLLRRARRALAHPATGGLALDSPETTARRREIFAEKRFLHALHDEWYRWIAARVPEGEGAVLELGSGAGFLRDRIPLLRSDVIPGPDLDLLADGRQLPLADASLRAITMVNVLHHLPEVERFLAEAARCLRPGGAVLMIEPWLTPWSRVVYSTLQDEPCHPEAPDWSFVSAGPLSGSNLALPWILLHRDRDRFRARHPGLEIGELLPTMPVSYLLSGGIGTRFGLPGWCYRGARAFERILEPLERGAAMFARIRLTRHP